MYSPPVRGALLDGKGCPLLSIESNQQSVITNENLLMMGAFQWGLFFSFQGKLTNCRQKRQEVLNNGIIGKDGMTRQQPDAFMPDCKEDGSFQEIQCHTYDGNCWCVDDNGIEMLGTRGKDRNLNCTTSMYLVIFYAILV